MYGTLFPLADENQCYCVSINYTFVNSNTLSVFNSFIDHSPKGLTYEPGDLSFSKSTFKLLTRESTREFFVRVAPAFVKEPEIVYLIHPMLSGGIFQVLKLGPLNEEGLYEWAGFVCLPLSLTFSLSPPVISQKKITPAKQILLYILARDPEVSDLSIFHLTPPSPSVNSTRLKFSNIFVAPGRRI
jgi:hypothetical protein